MRFIRYLLAYRDFNRTWDACIADLRDNGYFGQPARNNQRCGAWFGRAR